MKTKTLGIHIMVMPLPGKEIAHDAIASVGEALSMACAMNKCTLHDSYIGSDHVHVLIEANDEEGALHVIPEAIDSMKLALLGTDPEFQFQEGVHVTLIPPWHIQVLGSFVRDQARYHQSNSVEDELNTIFRPGLVGVAEFDKEPAAAPN